MPIFHHASRNKYSLSTNLKNLPGIVDQLAATLQQDNIVAPNHVFLTEYWDPTVDNRGAMIGILWCCAGLLVVLPARSHRAPPF